MLSHGGSDTKTATGRAAVEGWSSAALRRRGAARQFTGRQLDMIAVPLGGIGAGCISLGGWGQLRDWEIFGRPNKGLTNDMAFFSLFARQRGGRGANRSPDILKVLQGPAAGPRMGPPHPESPFSIVERGGTWLKAAAVSGANGFWGRSSAAGLPHFRSCTLTAHYPFADLDLADTTMPLAARLSAWNPFIPLDEKASSMPCAIFQWTITNPTHHAYEGTLFFNLTNLLGYPEVGRSVNDFRDQDGLRGLWLTTNRHAPDSPRHGTIAVTTDHREVTYLRRWVRGAWCDSLRDFWAQASGATLDESVKAEESPGDRPDIASIGLRFSLAPGASITLPLVVSWHVPVQQMYWKPVQPGACCTKQDPGGSSPSWKTWYATQWGDAWDVARHVMGDIDRLESQTRLYDETLRASTLPGHVLEAVAATSSILKSPTCMRLTDGTLWAWEGCWDIGGCCDGTCTHVWNYQQMLPHLFPGLERTIRDAEYTHGLHEDGHMDFRLLLPLGTHGSQRLHAAADGQLGAVLKVYREWRIGGDDAWLVGIWPRVKRSLEFAWESWDRDRDGILEGVQHNTYDIEFWGPNTLCGSLYLGALRAGAEMAAWLGDQETSQRYLRLFERGRAWTDAHLWNGGYYIQKVDPEAGKDDRYARPAEADVGPARDEAGRPNYQYGEGCLSDQLLGQLYAEMLELGDLYDPAHIDRAARSIFRHNWRTDFFDHANVQRIYAQDEERGLVLCTWPRGNGETTPFPYADEVWTGTEYATAALLAYRGHVDEALAVVKGARDRYDGTRRNPFDEFECGHHYARAMASYAVLLALSGFTADLPNARVAFRPRINERRFACFFSTGTGWGLFSQSLGTGGRATYRLEVRWGSLELRTLTVARVRGRIARVQANLGGTPVSVTLASRGACSDIIFPAALLVDPAHPLVVTRRPER